MKEDQWKEVVESDGYGYKSYTANGLHYLSAEASGLTLLKSHSLSSNNTLILKHQ